MIRKNLNHIPEQGYNFDYSLALNQGWDIFRKTPLLFIAYTLIFGAITTVLGLIPIIGTLAAWVIVPALTGGYYIASRELDKDREIEISTFFRGFNFLLPLFLVGLIVGILQLIGFFLLIIPGIWFGVATFLAPLIVIFAKLEFWDSIESSIRIVNKKWFQFFFFLILIFFINILGLICLGIGLLITIPLTYCIFYAVYKQVIGFSEADKGDDSIMDHLIN